MMRFGFSILLCSLSSIFVGSLVIAGEPGGPKLRACDSFIQQYCTGSGRRGPSCLKGHESDVSAACLQDMQRKGPVGRPPEGSGSADDSSAASSAVLNPKLQE